MKHYLQNLVNIKKEIGYFNELIDIDFSKDRLFYYIWLSGLGGGLMGGMTGFGSGAIIVSMLIV